LYLPLEIGQPPGRFVGSWFSHTSTAPQLTAELWVPHCWPCTEQLVPTGGQGTPASSVRPASLPGARQTGSPHVKYHRRRAPPSALDELPPEPDDAPELVEPAPEEPPDPDPEEPPDPDDVESSEASAEFPPAVWPLHPPAADRATPRTAIADNSREVPVRTPERSGGSDEELARVRVIRPPRRAPPAS